MVDSHQSEEVASAPSPVMRLLLRIRDALDGFILGLQQYVALRVAVGIAIIFLMANLDALVDLVIQPETPYLAAHHLIIGAVSALVTTILFGVLSIYVATMKRATREITTLKGLLPICARCNKIRTPENRWDLVEKYISERAHVSFTHSLCPDCARALYPEMYASGSSPRPAD